MNNFQLFKEIYIRNWFHFGYRVSKKSLLYCIKDEKVVDIALNNLYTKCPAKFPGENLDEKYYLLKDKWQILSQIWLVIQNCKQKPLGIFKNIKLFIGFLFDLKSSRNFYMHPTKIRRNRA